MSDSVNNVVPKPEPFVFSNLSEIVGKTEYERQGVYQIMEAHDYSDIGKIMYNMLACAPVDSSEVARSLLVEYPASGSVADPFSTVCNIVWANLLEAMVRSVKANKYEFYLERFLSRKIILPDTFFDMVRFYGRVTGRHYEQFARNTYFTVYRKQTHNCLWLQYSTSYSEGFLMDFTVHLPFSYDPRLFMLIGLILMVRSFKFDLYARDLAESHGFDLDEYPEATHSSGSFPSLGANRHKLDVLDLAFLSKYSPQFCSTVSGSLLALTLRSIDSRVGDSPFVGRHECEEYISHAYNDHDEDGISLVKFLESYSPIQAILDRIAVRFE
jgi:hypothetical protein